MTGSLVADLGIGPEIWLFVTLLLIVTLFFKFSRFWSVRNLDLLLLFALAPGMMQLVGNQSAPPRVAYVALFLGSILWLVRCLIDLGLTRRPILEPNLNASGLACLTVGVLGLLVFETVSPSVPGIGNRNPADSKTGQLPDTKTSTPVDTPTSVAQFIEIAPLPSALKANNTQIVLRRVISSLAQVGLTIALVAVGWRHYGRPIAGLSAATGYLLLPYTRFSLDDAGQVLPAALIVTSVLCHRRALLTGILIGLAAGWMPACVGLIPLWCGYHRGWNSLRFAFGAVGILAICVLFAVAFPDLAIWTRGIGARTLLDAGLLPQFEAPTAGSFWNGMDASYRLPVLVAYLILVIIVTFWPSQKNLGELIALSAALLIASQFWYLDSGGTLIVLYSPLLLLMMFRPNLIARRAFPRTPAIRKVQKPLFNDL